MRLLLNHAWLAAALLCASAAFAEPLASNAFLSGLDAANSHMAGMTDGMSTKPARISIPVIHSPQGQVGTQAPPRLSADAGSSAEQQSRQRALRKAADVVERNEFQEFLLLNSGQKLPLHGADLFLDSPSTFAPADQAQVTNDYTVGAGDELLIRAWGQVDIDYRAAVDRNGNIHIPQVGTIHVAGLKLAELNGYLKTAVGRVFHSFELNASLSQMRAIQVLLVGQAKYPGSYTVSALSTLVNTLFAAGGPSAKGSMRRIQLKRDNRVVSEFDLYDLLLRGDKSRDLPLLHGDVVFIPPVGKLAAIHGSIINPAIYELNGKETLAELIDMAGGLSTTAEGKKVTVERITERSLRTVAEFTLDQGGLARPMQDGDVVRVYDIVPRFDNAVTLRGNVATPARFPWREGMRVRDIIPSREGLLSRSYWLTKSALIRPPEPKADKGPGADGAGRLYADLKRNAFEINWDYAVVERLSPVDLTTSLIPFNLGKAIIHGDAEQNLPLMPGDIVTIFSKDDIQVPLAKQSQYVRLEGEIAGAGVYRIEPGETLRQLVARCGGMTPNAYLFGAEFTRESTRIAQQKKLEEFTNKLERDLERAATSKAQSAISPEDAASLRAQQDSQRALVARLRQIKATGRVVLEIPPELAASSSLKTLPDLVLEDGDRFFVPPLPSTVNVIGSVYNENSFIFKPGKEVSDYLHQSGGTTRDADNASMYVVRADGSVISKRQTGWFGGFEGETLMPGDTVVIPEKTDKVSWIKELKDWSQIFYQFGLGVSAIKVLRQ